MKIHIVCAHPETQSLNGALLARGQEAMDRLGWEVKVSDLYRMGFDPVVRAADFQDHDPSQRLDYYAEQKRAYASGTLAHEIADEIAKIEWCDVLILQFPLYWFSMPAIMKGWVDRVFVPGFAFGSGAWYERGGLVGKRAMVVTTMAAFPEMMEPTGINGLLDVNLWPIQNGILAFCGFSVLRPFIVNAAPYLDSDQANRALADYEKRLQNIGTDEPLLFHRRDDFDKRWRLRDDVEPRTVGHAFARDPHAAILRSGTILKGDNDHES